MRVSEEGAGLLHVRDVLDVPTVPAVSLQPGCYHVHHLPAYAG